uniref:Uncharacterized protein n=1 Tax=Aegilops tauschii TaxID=37682 RepID=M8C7G0_AEGTA
MSRAEVRTTFLEDLAEDYHGDTYHLIARNCYHFTADVCKHFTGKPTPGWVNRLARLALCSIRNSVLTESIKVSAVRGEIAHLEFSGTYPTGAHGCDDFAAFMDQPTCNHGYYVCCRPFGVSELALCECRYRLVCSGPS